MSPNPGRCDQKGVRLATSPRPSPKPQMMMNPSKPIFKAASVPITREPGLPPSAFAPARMTIDPAATARPPNR